VIALNCFNCVRLLPGIGVWAVVTVVVESVDENDVLDDALIVLNDALNDVLDDVLIVLNDA